MSDLRALPSVDQLIQAGQDEGLVARYGRPLVVEAIRSTLDEIRSSHTDGSAIPHQEQILERAGRRLSAWLEPTLMPVVNATGVVLHTNLGRAPLSRDTLEAIYAVSHGYSTLEYNLERGSRGSRSVHAEALLTRLIGAEAALVVNNNAAAVMLALMALGRRRRVVIARSQLVEIGGGFRVPDVMKLSGARLVEVGTTNRVHKRDFEEALEESAALVLRAHHSNFQIVGFTSEPSIEELVEVAHRHGVYVMDDIGSGALLDTAKYGLSHEPMVQESLAAGVDVVCFSGDKLLGGPQAGIIAGKAELIAKMKRHPFARAVRSDKLALAGLSATLLHYLKGEAECQVPVWRMISAPLEELRQRAERWRSLVEMGEVVPGFSTVGGGSLPGESLPTCLLALQVRSPNRFLARLRQLQPPVIARIEDERVMLDPRTVFPEQEGALLAGLRTVAGI